MASRRTRSSGHSSTLLSPHLKSKISLVWVKRLTPLYGHLSTNVLREACQYLSFRPLLAKCSRRELLVFYPSDTRFRKVNTQHTEPSINTMWRAECVCIGDDQIFMCGGYNSYGMSTSAKTLVVAGELVVQLRDMRSARHLHGLYYDEASRRVFAFGGRLKTNGISKNCEQYDISSGFWQKLPQMIIRRNLVSACGHEGKVYLCGYAEQCEMFSITARQFALIPVLLHPSLCICVAAIWQKHLVLIQGHSVRVWDTGTYKMIEKTISDEMYEGPVLVHDNTLYCLEFSECRCLDLEGLKSGQAILREDRVKLAP